MGEEDSLRGSTDPYRGLGMGNSGVRGHMVLALAIQKSLSFDCNQRRTC